MHLSTPLLSLTLSLTATTTTASPAPAIHPRQCASTFYLQVSSTKKSLDGTYIQYGTKSRNGATTTTMSYSSSSSTTDAAAFEIESGTGYLYSPAVNSYLNVGAGGAEDGSASLAYLDPMSAVTSDQYLVSCSVEGAELSCNAASTAGYTTPFLYPDSGSAGDVYIGVTSKDWDGLTLNVVCA
ncbi:hypothetical protein F5Y16DRAFT_352374 [Xylariaceae sp. FL0255]|nr:hypothetical protein F5Y16DRAFT_352374 [Xylariaceae sp. FL0255]